MNTETLISKLKDAGNDITGDAFGRMLTEQARIENPAASEITFNTGLSISIDGGSDPNRYIHITTGSSLFERGQGTQAIADLINSRGGHAHQELHRDTAPGARTPSFSSSVDISFEDFQKIAPDLERSFQVSTSHPYSVPSRSGGQGLSTNDAESCAMWKRLSIQMPGCTP
ncbi:MAG: hypothetical protein ACLPPF_12320 [Rhodomicrobium sp.]